MSTGLFLIGLLFLGLLIGIPLMMRKHEEYKQDIKELEEEHRKRMEKLFPKEEKKP